MRIFLLFLIFLSGCSVTVRERKEIQTSQRLTVNCPSHIYTKGYYCTGDRAKSKLIQPWSKVKITNVRNYKSITLAVMYDKDTEGVCVPERYSHILGQAPFPARLDIERCGREGTKDCPSKIEGVASYYAEPYHNRESTYGIPYDMYGMYAAHKSLPLGTLLRVVNPRNGKEVIVKVIDRGPFKEGRVLDLSYEAAKKLGIVERGEEHVVAYVLRCGE
ncbi:MAG: septal ring lytic transglycosylase RlpA family protein [Hydrogenobacter sp.]|uniref:septal ring lytic transglycosylase RlpA family protein n=1 Tax=Hydrogenobacter thermophilus TaxID=940 RepID=UPI0030F937E0